MTRTYSLPNFSAPELARAPDATFLPTPADGVLPEGFFSTTNLPTYVRVNGSWKRPSRPRMDCAIVLGNDGTLETVEQRAIRAGTPVAMGEAEDGSLGILVHGDAFLSAGPAGEFKFMSSEVSRERPVNYERLADLLLEERENHGHVLWVAGPALVHSRARDDMTWFIENGFVGAMLAGNALAVHDIEAAMFGTTLGMTSQGDPTDGGHALHMRAINRVRAAGSIAGVVESGEVSNGIMHSLVSNDVPFVLAGSIRDDGPLPDVITDAVKAQEAMREHAVRATGAVFIATALHAIAVGNMLPAFVETGDDNLRPLATICVDQTEFIVNKLKDRGTHQAFGVVTNAQDFMHILRSYVEERIMQATR